MRRNRETDDMWPSMRRQMAVMWQLCEKYPSMDFYRMCGGRKTGCRITSQLGCSRLSFASGEEMEEMLGCSPGSSSILGLMNDKDNRVRLVVDEDVLKAPYLGCHPCINTTSLKLHTEDAFGVLLKAVHHDMTVVKLSGER